MTARAPHQPRHSALVAVEKRYLDIPSLSQRLDMYFDYWPRTSVDFWRHERDVADLHAGLLRIKRALDVRGPRSTPTPDSARTPGTKHPTETTT